MGRNSCRKAQLQRGSSRNSGDWVAHASRVQRQSGSDFRRLAETIIRKARDHEDAIASTRGARYPEKEAAPSLVDDVVPPTSSGVAHSSFSCIQVGDGRLNG